MKVLNAKKLNELMEAQMLTVSELSAASGLSMRTIKTIFKNDSVKPRLSTLKSLADALKVNPADLVMDVEEDANKPVDGADQQQEEVCDQQLQEVDDQQQEIENEQLPSRKVAFIVLKPRRSLKEDPNPILVRQDMLVSVQPDFKEPRIWYRFETEYFGKSVSLTEYFEEFGERDERWIEVVDAIMNEENLR